MLAKKVKGVKHIPEVLGNITKMFVKEARGGYVPYHILPITFIDGEDLTNEDAPKTEKEILQVLQKACVILKNIHAKGVVFRDFKKDNVMFKKIADGTYEVYAVDFGL